MKANLLDAFKLVMQCKRELVEESLKARHYPYFISISPFALMALAHSLHTVCIGKTSFLFFNGLPE